MFGSGGLEKDDVALIVCCSTSAAIIKSAKTFLTESDVAIAHKARDSHVLIRRESCDFASAQDVPDYGSLAHVEAHSEPTRGSVAHVVDSNP